MRSSERPFLFGLVLVCLLALPATAEARTQADGRAARPAKAFVHAGATQANCDADVFLYNYRPRKAKG